MSTKTETKHTGEFLVSEAPGTLSRDEGTVTVPASTTYEAGYVLGKITSTGKHVPYDNAASDGREAAAAVLYNTLVNDTASPVDMTATLINLNAEVRDADLVWLDADNDKAAGIADLLALGIKSR